MTLDQVARKLRLSQTMVRIIEREALEKVALFLGLDPPPRARWHASLLAHKRGAFRCHRCGRIGHTSKGCR